MSEKYPEKRSLCGIFMRVNRDGKWENVCWSDLTETEREDIARKRASHTTVEEQVEWWKSMTNIMAERLHEIGDEFDIIASFSD